MPANKRAKLTNFTIEDTVYKVNDCILVRGVGEKLPYIGRIRDIYAANNSGDVQVKVSWFYRPEEAQGGRKAFHGERELFKSDHFDQCSSSTIDGKCTVHTLKNYQGLQNVKDTDYFARFTYKPRTQDFTPDRVPVYCLCEMPYNPDHFMVMCEQCEEWYHPACLGVTDKEAVSWSHFVCSECKQKSA